MRRLRWTLLPLLLAGACATTAEPADAALDRLFATLARPAPTATGFVEQRESALLDAPLLLRGRLERPAPGVLLREVETPYRERTRIDGDAVRVERDGGKPRRFSLRRAPELAALLASFQALLDGDRAALDPHYTLRLDHGDAGWTIRLQPRQPRLAKRIGGIALHGRDAELACIAMRGGSAGDSLMLVGAAAEATPADFAGHCGTR
jgi:hypothetical protein